MFRTGNKTRTRVGKTVKTVITARQLVLTGVYTWAHWRTVYGAGCLPRSPGKPQRRLCGMQGTQVGYSPALLSAPLPGFKGRNVQNDQNEQKWHFWRSSGGSKNNID